MNVSVQLKLGEVVSNNDFTGLPENQLGNRDRPKFHDDQNPNCGLVGTMSRYAAL
jgi:hypothetical protein